MHYEVVVSFGEDKEFDFKLSAADLQGRSADAARQWFAREFEELECEVATPLGKILIADSILSVAKYSGERRFREQPQWAAEFAKNAAVLIGRELIRVDVAKYAMGY
jgi:hypothetical protein